MDQGSATAFSMASKPMKWALSFAVFYCCFALGIMMTFLGPTVTDFGNKFETTVDHVSKVFTVITACYCVGALISGVLFNFINRQIVVTFVLAAAAAALFAMPYVTSITVFFTLGGVVGFGGGTIDCAQVAWIIDIWRHDAGPFLLCGPFAYSLGTLIPPLLFAPFLTEEAGDGTNTTTGTSSTTETAQSSTAMPAPSSDLYIPFTVSGLVVSVAVAILVVLYFVFRRQPSQDIPKNNDHTEQTQTPGNKKDLWRRKIPILALACIFIGFYAGMELTTFSFLPTFAIEAVGMTKAEGATVLLWLTIGFAIGRGLGIIVILKVAPQHILYGNFILVLIGNTLLLTLGGSSVPWLWVGSILLGLGFSTMYPAIYAYVEKHVFVSDTVAAINTMFAGVVTAIYPVIVGNSVETNYKILNYVDYLSFGMALASFATLLWLTFPKKENPKQSHVL